MKAILLPIFAEYMMQNILQNNRWHRLALCCCINNERLQHTNIGADTVRTLALSLYLDLRNKSQQYKQPSVFLSRAGASAPVIAAGIPLHRFMYLPPYIHTNLYTYVKVFFHISAMIWFIFICVGGLTCLRMYIQYTMYVQTENCLHQGWPIKLSCLQINTSLFGSIILLEMIRWISSI